mmetsp:Transcript_22329/g.31249  ORF Transcript_22329/g.31249 Transcript_22329/m.31249 type:complete len:290 (+) Transcript_22329:136-1005(+)|eukprot:CAMPEP_0184502622 /NCGR_PEP_ID=MMETSP0113_2-20130426/50868_1 /TAXON_ID=91329 /ORGANISM="Norrisiella sphaerica, Strain BC52" /LENGTH=289 /DNA_ID=CAMNT_0026891889 /DNA_START=154 /DNA_END=1023 /DNA_ORIENTATION=+
MPHQVTGSTYYLKQKVNYLEAITSSLGFGCCEQRNFYSVIDEEGEVAYTAEEKSGCCCRCCCAPNHKFQLNIYDGTDVKSKPVMTMFHPFRCSGWCPICLDCQRGELIVYDGEVNAWEEDEEGPILSHAKQPICGGYLTPTFHIQDGKYDDEKEPSYTIKSGTPCCIGGLVGECCCPPTFSMLKGKGDQDDEKKDGEIIKDKPDGIGGAMKEAFTDADSFTINMPPEATPETKAAILASSLLIDYLFFEDDGNIFCENGDIVCVCCNCYCCGAICPCTIRLSLKNKEEG